MQVNHPSLLLSNQEPRLALSLQPLSHLEVFRLQGPETQAAGGL